MNAQQILELAQLLLAIEQKVADAYREAAGAEIDWDSIRPQRHAVPPQED